MGACFSCFNIRDPEEDEISPSRTPNCILWDKFTRAKSHEQSNAPALTSEVSAPLNSDAASNNIQSNNVITSSPRYSGQEDEDEHMEHVSNGNNSTGVQGEPPLTLSYERLGAEANRACGSSENEDVCPTCLEEYFPENPRIVLQCCHGYHLGCIYEWMERSANCPICGKMMIFNEEA